MLNAVVTADGSPAVTDAFGESGSYGFGWVKKRTPAGTIHLHTGKVPQSTSIFILVPEAGLGIVLLADVGDFLVRGPMLEDLGADIVRVLLGHPRAAPPTTSRARVRQGLLCLGYVAFIGVGFLGWSPGGRPRGPLASFAYHVALPAALPFALRRASGTPTRWLFRFVPDAAVVLAVGCSSMLASGLTRAARILLRPAPCRRRANSTRPFPPAKERPRRE